MAVTYKSLPRMTAESSWLGYTPCGLFALTASVPAAFGSGQKISEWGWAPMALAQKAVRLAEKPESGSGESVTLVIGGVELPAGKAWITPRFPRSRASPSPSKFGSLKSGLSSAKIWVTKTVSSEMLPVALSVIAMAVGLPPNCTAPSRAGFSGLLVRMIDTVPSLLLAK